MQFTQFHTRTFTDTRMCDDKIMNYDVLSLAKLAYTYPFCIFSPEFCINMDCCVSVPTTKNVRCLD